MRKNDSVASTLAYSWRLRLISDVLVSMKFRKMGFPDGHYLEIDEKLTGKLEDLNVGSIQEVRSFLKKHPEE